MRKTVVVCVLAAGLFWSGWAADSAGAGRGGGSSGGHSSSGGGRSSLAGHSSSSGLSGRSYSSPGASMGRSYSSGSSAMGRSYSSGSRASTPVPRFNPGRPRGVPPSSKPAAGSATERPPSSSPPSASHANRPSSMQRPLDQVYSSGAGTDTVRPRPDNRPLGGQRYSVGNSPLSGKSYASGGGARAAAGHRPTGPGYDVQAAESLRKEQSRVVFQKGQQPRPTYTDPKGKTRPIEPKDQRVERLRRELDHQRWVNRQQRQQQVFGRYYSAPPPVVVNYSDPYSNFFWWWLLDRTLEERALWAYHHRLSMDDARYHDLLARDAGLEARIRELEARGVPGDVSYRPDNIDSDLMYTKDYVEAAYNPEPVQTTELEPTGVSTAPEGDASAVAQSEASPSQSSSRARMTPFVVLGLLALIFWLIFIKRWGGSDTV